MARTEDVSTAVPSGAFWEALQSGRLPTQDEFVQGLTSMDPLQAVLLLAVGLTYMIVGYRVYKVLVTANAACLGFALGHVIGRLAASPHDLPAVTGIAGALLLGVLSWPLMKFTVSLMGALVGGLAGMLLWQYLFTVAGRPELVSYSWTGGLLGLVTLGMLTFLTLPFTTMVFTSLQGSGMAVSAVLSMLLHYERFRMDVEDGLTNNIHLLPLLIAVPAIVAVVVQDATAVKKAKKKP
ncbi:MAG: hypothetical protein MUP47_03010 [Phycisphaerae bacterium]|nr:hypothetical protein [Phycisphaerae bacterium]